MLSAEVFLFFTKEASGMDYQYMKSRKELSKLKPDPIEMKDPMGDMHRKHIKGLVQPRLATKRPAVI